MPLTVLLLLRRVQEEHRTEAGLLDLAASPQLQHQLSVLSMALQSAQLDPAQFGLKPTVSRVLLPWVVTQYQGGFPGTDICRGLCRVTR